MNGYIVAGLLAFAALCGLGGVWEGERLGATKCQAAQLPAAQDATKVMAVKADKQLQNGDAALGSVTAANANQAQIQVVHDVVTKTVTKYVQAHPTITTCGLDADGLRIWNSANAGQAISQ